MLLTFVDVPGPRSSSNDKTHLSICVRKNHKTVVELYDVNIRGNFISAENIKKNIIFSEISSKIETDVESAIKYKHFVFHPTNLNVNKIRPNPSIVGR